MAPERCPVVGNHVWSISSGDMTDTEPEQSIIGVLSIQKKTELYLDDKYIGNIQDTKKTMKQLSKQIAKHLLKT